MTSTRLLLALLLAPAALVIGLVRPGALLALLLLTVVAAAVARVGLWLVGAGAGEADAQAVRVGAGVFAASVAVSAIVLALGQASVPVLAVLAVVSAAGLARRIRPGRTAL